MSQHILVTGAAGFIGAHLCTALAHAGHHVVACDRLADDDPQLALRRARVRSLLRPLGIACHRTDLAEPGAAQALLASRPFDAVIHLAARPGVRDSVRAPLDYVGPNLVAFAQVLEACHQTGVTHLMYASSSSVYGDRSRVPFFEDERCDEPASFYAATKRCNELLAHAHSTVTGLATTGLRLFTVYGPWGRPDMACFEFSRRILRGQPIILYGHGHLMRDFTFIDDVVVALTRLIERGPPRDGVPARLLNIGHRKPVALRDFVTALEQALGRTAAIEYASMPLGDVPVTCADAARLEALIGPWPETPLADGLASFADWLQTWEREADAPAVAWSALNDRHWRLSADLSHGGA